MKKIPLLIAAFFVPFFLLADDDYIDSFSDDLLLRLSWGEPMLEFDIENTENSRTLEYYSNTKTALGLTVGYKNFSLSLSRDIGYDENEEKYGKTRYTDVQLYYFTRHFGTELYYQRYKGYYLDEPDRYGAVAGDSTAKRPDIKAAKTGVNVYYLFSDNYSFNAFINQSERQNRWDWSFLLFASIEHTSVRGERSLIPDSEKIYYYNYSGYRGGSATAVVGGPGIAATLPIYHFYLSASAMLGFGPELSHLLNIEHLVDYNKINFKLGIGYNGDVIFYGAAMSFDVLGFNADEDIDAPSVKTYSGYLEFFCGCRI